MRIPPFRSAVRAAGYGAFISGWLMASLLCAQDFSRMRGAGLIDKQGPGFFPPEKFRESDFRFLKENGFNFVRLPMAYQFWTVDGNPDLIDEAKMREIDEAVRWGREYGQHVCICFYSVPGYSVSKPEQKPSLWTDEATQKRFVEYWRVFAKRYQGVPPEQLSFNLINEPDWYLPEEKYSPVMQMAMDAIREIDPKRPIVVDGLKAGRKPVMSLAGKGVVQAVHFYEPFPFTHYGAPWLEDGQRLPRPDRWPAPRITQHLFGPQNDQATKAAVTTRAMQPGEPVGRPREGKHTPLVIRGSFGSPCTVRLRIGGVEALPGRPLTVVMLADGKEIARQDYFAAPPDNEAQPSDAKPVEKWVDADFTGSIPAGTKVVEIWVDSGVRVTFRELGIRAEKQPLEQVLSPGGMEWEAQTAAIEYTEGQPLETDAYFDKAWIRNQLLKEWQPLIDRGGQVMVQEFGCYTKTPHQAVLRYLKDCTAVWNELGWGWALWSVRGSMGIINNGREAIETSEKSPVDVQMLRVMKDAAQSTGGR